MKKIKLIAETAWHHDGEFSFMEHLLDTILNQSKADAVKMHVTLDFDEYMDSSHSIYNDLKSKLFSLKQWTDLIKTVKNKNKDLMLLYNDIKAIEFGSQFDPLLVEIHSVCLNDIHLLDAVKNNIDSKTKVVLGVGGSTLKEINSAIDRINHENIVLMFGFQNFPTKYEDINYLKMKKIKSQYPDFSFGYADHTAWDEPNNVLITLLGAAQGVEYIEKHVTTLYGQERTDWQSAVSIEMFNEIADKIKILDECEGNGLLDLNEGEKTYSVYGPMKKAGILKVDVSKGDKHKLENIVFKRTGETTDLSQVDLVNKVESKYRKDKSAGSLLYKIDLD